MAQGMRGTDGGSDGSVLPLGSRSGDGDHFFHPVPSQGAVDQRLSLSLVQLAVTKPGRGRERVNTGRLLAGAAGSGSQLPAHARLLAVLPGDRSLPACICCGVTRFVPLLPPLAASHQHPGPSQGNDSPARPRSPLVLLGGGTRRCMEQTPYEAPRGCWGTCPHPDGASRRWQLGYMMK